MQWIDFTRRNDPACKAGGERLRNFFINKQAPDVLCFWTKSPQNIVKHCGDSIKKLLDAGTLVLAQVTANFYPAPLEQVKSPDFSGLLNHCRFHIACTLSTVFECCC